MSETISGRSRTHLKIFVIRKLARMHRRFRDWIRPWNWSTRRWVIAVLTMMLVSPFLTRWYCLWQVPDVALPFNEKEFLSIEDVAEEDDAFVEYQAAIQTFTANRSKWMIKESSAGDPWDSVDKALTHPDQPRDSKLDEWVRENSITLDHYRRGGKKPRAKGPSLRTMDDIDTTLTPHSYLRRLARLARVQSLICEANDQVDTAWQWLRAILQSSRHAEATRIDVCRSIGIEIRAHAFQGIVHWSQSPLVTADQLRSARKEVQVEATRRTTRSDCSKGEYLCKRNTLLRKDAPDYLLPSWNKGIAANPAWLPLKQIGLWFLGQPEGMLRVQRQLLVNNGLAIDLPLSQRAATVPCDAALVLEVANERVRGQMKPEALAKALEGSSWRVEGASLSVSRRYLDESIHRDDTRLSVLMVVLACQEHYRDHGEFPVTLEELVPEYLDDILFDPMLSTVVPMKYRRNPDGDAVVGSISQNGRDDNNVTTALDRVTQDVGYLISKPSRRIPSALTPSNTPREDDRP
jgi:hypothetical protein